MSDRWKMNRIGFVNFWLYDEEEFAFEDGKLLLRGQNGSGKSITTQSFIPFVLDGDRTPSRLDPFGSSDRRMEYYFLGEEDRDEATGYLYLELKSEQTGEYRTIGIGQRAKRGKPMDFWGFVILDGRRVGYDLWLYREVGSSKIPYDKRELKNELGETNPVTDNQGDYKKLVNRYLFGFRKEEQYEQFIRLLVKVRAPKLSKEFKPTKVYEILNDSLQTLTDEDLRSMVDAMEKMDEMQDSLETLRRALTDVRAIRTEYSRYNQYMLAQKAQAYLGKKQETEKTRAQLEQLEQQKQQTDEEHRAAQQSLSMAQEQIRLAKTEREGLLDEDLEGIDLRLQQARSEKDEAERQQRVWEERADECNRQIRESSRRQKAAEERLEQMRKELRDAQQELNEYQEILQWDGHGIAQQLIAEEKYQKEDEITGKLRQLKKGIENCQRLLQTYEELVKRYDELAQEADVRRRIKSEKEQALQASQEQLVVCRDQWITELYDRKKAAQEWKPQETVLRDAEEMIKRYHAGRDAGAVREILRKDYEAQRGDLLEERSRQEHAYQLREELYRETQEQLDTMRSKEEIEPTRDENAERTRRMLYEAGIPALPFYKTVEFADGLDEAACALLECQLSKTGLLDALVVPEEGYRRIREEFPEFADTVLYVEREGTSDFAKLVVNEELDPEMQKAVRRILRSIYEKDGAESELYISADGSFRQGILAGKAAGSCTAEYVGQLARRRRREQEIQRLERQLAEVREAMEAIREELRLLAQRELRLHTEYDELPDFVELDAALEQEISCTRELENAQRDCAVTEGKCAEAEQKKERQYQLVIRECKGYSYTRTFEAYGEAGEAAEEYQQTWTAVRELLLRMEGEHSACIAAEEVMEQNGQHLDEALTEVQKQRTRGKECDIRISQLEEYLNRPEIVQKAARLKELNAELLQLEEQIRKLDQKIAILGERLRHLSDGEPEQREKLQNLIIAEHILQTYFEEELDLGLVFEREEKRLSDCAEKAVSMLRESDRGREPADMLRALYQVYQAHNGSLAAAYGTALEDWFTNAQEAGEQPNGVSIVRKRVRVVSTWNGKKVYLEEFYRILKGAIEETELLIREKDRELFENILSQTLSRQLTDRIAESRKWVRDMSGLMQDMDTSMGLTFSLDWKPCRAENEEELDTSELEQILLRDSALLTAEDIEKVAAHFRSRIHSEKIRLEEVGGGAVNYMDLVRDALDYRKWFEFRMFYQRGTEQRKPLTNGVFNRFSGGEKAMAMYVPLFAAVNAQYKKAADERHPRMIALDEAFAGVDDKNISSMFELVHRLDFDYIMNSQALWGCYETVQGLRIAELIRPQNSQTVSVIRYTWNGRERLLDEQ